MRNYTTLAIWAENDQATSLQIYATLAGLRFELAEHVNGKRVEINVGQKGLRQLRAFIDAHLESVRPER